MPTAETVEKVLAAISTKAEADYFLDSIRSPDWVRPLAGAGFFKSPPPPIVEGEGVRFPFWHESQYLARMAHLAPDEVLEIVLQIPDTENVRVHEDLLDAALAMPPRLAVRLTERALQWAESPYQLLLPLKLGALALHLARGGEGDSAVSIMRVLLTIPTQLGEDEDADETSIVRPTARVGDFEYQRILKETVPQLVGLVGMPAFDLLCELLDDLVQRFHGHGQGVPAGDSSRIWHPDLEEGGPYEHGGNESHLTAALLNAAVRLAEQNPGEIPELIAKLRSHTWGIFHRVGLELLRRFPTVPDELVHQGLLDRRGFDSPVIGREYGRLLQERFGSLDEAARLTILGWIEDGPNLERFRRLYASPPGEAPPQEEITDYVKQWQLDWLGLFADVLPPNWRQRYDELVRQFGPATEAHVAPPRIRMWSGTTSPKSGEELGVMPIDELVGFLKEWEPEPGFGVPSREGLAQELSEAVAADPSRFATEAMAFASTGIQLYTKFVLDGFWKAVRDHERPFPWGEVLTLCQEFLAQHPGASVQEFASGDTEGRPRIVAQLLQAGLRVGETEIPIEQRAVVWELLATLSTHRDPTPETEETYGGTNMDPVTLSLNHARGAAMNAIIDYAIWVWRHANDGERAAGFDLMPEVRDVLDWHLDIRNDPSLATRSVYGRVFPVLNAIDARWCAENLRRIFPAGQDDRLLWESAFGAFLLYAQLFLGAIVALREIYQDAVERLGQPALVPWHGTTIDVRLAEHLMTFFWHGRLEVANDEAGLLSQFFANAPIAVRARAVDFVGRSLQGTDDVDETSLRRLIGLWESRMAAIDTATNPRDEAKELEGFGWWFSSGRFEDNWALSQLLRVLGLGVEIDPSWHVAERLGTLAQAHPQVAVQCMRLLVEAAEKKWGIGLIRDSVRGLIKTVASSPDPQARSQAVQLANWLGARGYRDLRGVTGQPA